MSGLVELNNARQSQVAATPAPVMESSDVLMEKAHKTINPEPIDEGEQKYEAMRFETASNVVKSRIAKDPDYAEFMLSNLESSKDQTEYVQRLMDAGDQELIYEKMKTDPRFNSMEAANAAFADTALFGQLSRIVGGASSAQNALALTQIGQKMGFDSNGMTAEEVTRRVGEEFRLLGKAFPKANLAGQAAAFLIPSSPAKLLFEKAAGLTGAKIAKTMAGIAANGGKFGAIAANPLVQRSVMEGAKMAAGTMAYTGLKGTLGKDNQDFFDIDRLEEAGKETLKSGAWAFMLGSGIPVAGATIKATAQGSAKLAKSFMNMRTVENAVEGVTGTPVRALRAYNERGSALAEAAGTEADLGDEIVQFLTGPKSKVPESAQARALLRTGKIPDVEIQPLVSSMEKVRDRMVSKPNLAQYGEKMDQWITNIKARAGATETSVPTGDGLFSKSVKVPKAKVTASEMRSIVDDLQNASDDMFGKESNEFVSALKVSSRRARMDLNRVAAESGGEAGKQYVDLMAKAAEKVDTIKTMKKFFGRDPVVMVQRAESVIDRFIGKNTTAKEAVMKRLDKLYEMDFYTRTQNAQLAQELGGTGVPALMPAHATGKSLLGPLAGGSVAGVPGAVLGAVASSPRAGALVIGAADKISGFIKHVAENRQLMQSVAKSSANPTVVRQLADQIVKSLNKDGLTGMAGTMRIIADTPIFLAVAHAYDKEVQRVENKKIADANAKKVYGVPGITISPRGNY